MSTQTPLDAVLAAIAARTEDAAALASDLPFLYAALDRLVEATDIPSALWATGMVLNMLPQLRRRVTAALSL